MARLTSSNRWRVCKAGLRGGTCQGHGRVHTLPLRQELGICLCFLIRMLFPKMHRGLRDAWKSDKTISIRNRTRAQQHPRISSGCIPGSLGVGKTGGFEVGEVWGRRQARRADEMGGDPAVGKSWALSISQYSLTLSLFQFINDLR